MVHDLAKIILEDFLKSSWHCIEVIVNELPMLKEAKERKVNLFYFRSGVKSDIKVEGRHFFLRSSVEYSNPQLTVEEVQGIIATRLLEVCGNYFYNYGLHQADSRDVDAMCEMLIKPSEGMIFSFLLNTDEIEPDRYSMNPLKASIAISGQSAFPSASVTTNELKIDEGFARKYEGSLICRGDLELIARCLKTCSQSYLDMVDAAKYEQLERFSESFGINLCLYSMRMPLTILEKEATDGLFHHIIKQVHTDYKSVERTYNCMGRSIKNRTTLLTVPHSKRGYGSKRAARGKIYFDGMKLKSIKINYRTTPLYPNAIDPEDISVAKAEDDFVIEGDKLANYDFRETPSSPQFFLYSLGSPENAAIWHGIGAFGAQELLRSYASIRSACAKDSLISNLDRYGINVNIPLQFNLAPQRMWVHPTHRNIDASIGCVENLRDLANLGMKLEYLSVSAHNS